MSKIYKFDPVVYPRKLWVVVTKDEEYLNKTFRHECDLSGYDDRVDAMVFHCSLEETGEYGVAVVFAKKDKMTTKIMTHESVHVAAIIFDKCGMSMGFSDGQDEHFAYLAGWAADCMYKVKTGKV